MKSSVADYRYKIMCLRIVPKTGSPIRLTHYPRDVTMANSTVYLTGSGFDFTGYSASSNMAPAVVDLEGIAGAAGIDELLIASGIFDGARCYLFATTWTNPIEDEEPITASILGKAVVQDKRYRIEEMALIDALNQSVGQTYTASCQKTFGSQSYAGCKVALGPITVSGVISAVTSNYIFRDAARTEVLDYFAGGTVQITSGANALLKPQEIKAYAVDGTIEVFESFYYDLQVGDTYTMVPGCRKRLEDCRDKWNNVINFGGFSNVPTSSQYSQLGGK